MWKKTCQVIHYVIIRVSSKNIMVLLFCICVGMFETIIFIFCSTFMFLNLAWFVLDFSLIFYLPSKIIMFYQSLPLILHINPFTRFFYSSEMFSFLIVVVYSLSCVWLFVMLWTVACQDPLSMGFLRQEYWSELSFPSPGDLPNPVKPMSSALLHCRRILHSLSHWEPLQLLANLQIWWLWLVEILL